MSEVGRNEIVVFPSTEQSFAFGNKGNAPPTSPFYFFANSPKVCYRIFSNPIAKYEIYPLFKDESGDLFVDDEHPKQSTILGITAGNGLFFTSSEAIEKMERISIPREYNEMRYRTQFLLENSELTSSEITYEPVIGSRINNVVRIKTNLRNVVSCSINGFDMMFNMEGYDKDFIDVFDLELFSQGAQEFLGIYPLIPQENAKGTRILKVQIEWATNGYWKSLGRWEACLDKDQNIMIRKNRRDKGWLVPRIVEHAPVVAGYGLRVTQEEK
jgi:hypothetical protein